MIKQKRLVALFDILGFSQRLQSDPLAKVQRELRDLIRASRSHSFTEAAAGKTKNDDDDNLEHVRFAFDSVVLVSLETTVGINVHKFILACTALLELGFNRHFPFRGSIALSDVFVDEETGLLLGDQFPALREGEAMQDWSGCFIHPSALDVIWQEICGQTSRENSQANPEGHDLLVWTEVPLKTDYVDRRPFKAWWLNWGYFLGTAQREHGLSFMKPVSSKHDHTQRFLNWVADLPHDSQLLKGPVPEGTYIKTMRSRHGMRVRFCDKAGKPVQMPRVNLQYTVTAPDLTVFEQHTIDTRSIRSEKNI